MNNACRTSFYLDNFSIYKTTSMSTDFKPPVGAVKIPRVFHQLGILALDGSGSMNDKSSGNASKAKEVQSGVIELFNRLNASRVKQNFSFSCIKFDQTATITFQPLAFDFQGLMAKNFDPLEGKGGGTHIFSALDDSLKLAESFLNNGSAESIPHKVIILLMSDGLCFDPERTKVIAERIKSNPKILIACCYFATVGSSEAAAQNLLKEVSSDPATYYSTVYDGEALRAFFERSISQSAGIKIE